MFGAEHLLRAHVVGRAHHGACRGHAQLVAQALGDAKVQHLHERVVIGIEQEHVVRLDVAMHDALRVGFAERPTQLRDDLHCVARGQPPVAMHERRESLEARLVKAADVLDLLIQVYALERAGARGLDEFCEVAEKPEFNLDGTAEHIVQELLESILTARCELHTNV